MDVLNSSILNNANMYSSVADIADVIVDTVSSITIGNNNVKTESTMTKSKMVESKSGTTWIQKYKDGRYVGQFNVMPNIVDVREYEDADGNPCAIYLDFADGTSTSAARREGDVFSFEHGVTICIIKKLLDKLTDNMGSATYNKLVRKAQKLRDYKIEYEKKLIEEAKAQEAKAAKLAEKKRKRDERRAKQIQELEEQAREELIEIQKEAFLRALRESRMSEDDLK